MASASGASGAGWPRGIGPRFCSNCSWELAGQRIGDVLKMRWSDFDGEAINVRQSKTGTKLWIPATGELLAELEAAPRSSIWLLTNAAGTGPWSYRGAHDAMMRLRREIGAEAYDIHSLRYTATAELARLGLDDAAIMAITGHKTARMVQLYAGGEAPEGAGAGGGKGPGEGESAEMSRR